MPFIKDLKVSDTKPYFSSLTELDKWFQNLHMPLRLLPYPSRSDRNARGRRVLVCHDYKGGYQEDPCAFSYTFNFWSYCHTFVYFAHHRITVPPSGWVNAAHRQGTKMLGTVIFEGSGEEDVLRLLIGRLPSTSSHSQQKTGESMPISSHYATLLALLAQQRGFDGYLLNFECPLKGGPDQARSVCVWIDLLRDELKKVVGQHAEVIWYDSVVINGQLAWQDRLDYFNAPFFRPSTGFFTNYTWRPMVPQKTLEYVNVLPRSSKTPSDIYTGIDIWGRGQHANGGINAFKSLFHIPNSLSIAIFGQGWSWERVREEENYDWGSWWLFEQKFWVGESPATRKSIREGAGVNSLDPNRKPPPPCECDTLMYQPMTKSFEKRTVPDAKDLAFFTTFCPGVGRGWFVDGRQVWDKAHEWTDIDHQTSLGDLVWPSPVLMNEDGEQETKEIPWTCEPKIDMDEAWNGGSSLLLSFTKIVPSVITNEDEEEPSFWTLSCPIQQLTLSSDTSYTLSIWYQVRTPTIVPDDAEIDVGISVRPSAETEVEFTTDFSSQDDKQLHGGWIRTTANLSLKPTQHGQLNIELGLLLSILSPRARCSFSLLVGQISVCPSILPSQRRIKPTILYTGYSLQPHDGTPTIAITWATSHRFADPLNFVDVSRSADDPTYAWDIVEDTRGAMPEYVYFNLYSDDTWIASSDMGGRAIMTKEVLREAARKRAGEKVRIKVQGVTDRGETDVLEKCEGVDVELQ